MKPAVFAYHAPASVEEALGLLRELGDDAKVLAGGQSLVPMLSMRLSVFPHLIDVGNIGELDGIRIDEERVTVGAITCDSRVERDAGVADAAPLLSRVTPYIGHLAIRNRGTLGGSIAHADPAGEYPAAALALDAEMVVRSAGSQRRVGASEFFTGLWSTALLPEELLVEVDFPRWKGRSGFAVAEHARRHGDFAIAGAVVGVTLDDDERIVRAGIGLFGMASTPLRASTAEAELVGRPYTDCDSEQIGHLAVEGLDDVVADTSGSAQYRRQVAAAMVARAWSEAVKEASNA